MKNVIVTGADGFIGSAVVLNLLGKKYNVLAVVRDHLLKHDLSSADIMVLDLENIRRLPEVVSGSWDTWIHLAWQGTYGADRADANVQLTNVSNFVECMNAASSIGCSRFIGVGSIMELENIASGYDSVKYLNRPDYVYASAKSFSQAILFTYSKSLKMDAIWCTLTNVYGVGDTSTRLINYAVTSAIYEKEPHFSCCTQMYDFIYITDVAEAIVSVALMGHSGESYLLGSGAVAPLRSFIEHIHRTLAPNLLFHYDDNTTPGPNLPESFFSSHKLYEHTGFLPKTDFGEGIVLLKKWLMEARHGSEE